MTHSSTAEAGIPDNATAADLAAEKDLYCAACAHRQDAHDATGLRFCAATVSQGSTRSCICRGDLADVNPHINSLHRAI
jgi:hypothetical protein